MWPTVISELRSIIWSAGFSSVPWWSLGSQCTEESFHVKKVAIHAICVNSETNPNIKDFRSDIICIAWGKTWMSSSSIENFWCKVLAKLFQVKYQLLCYFMALSVNQEDECKWLLVIWALSQLWSMELNSRKVSYGIRLLPLFHMGTSGG